MSSKLHGLVWEGCAHTGMILSRVAVMARLADYSNDEGISWPSIDTIQRQIGAKSKNTVSAAIKELELDGWLVKQERKAGGRNQTNIYRLNVEKLEKAAAAASQFYRAKKGNTSITDPSTIDPPIIDPSNIEGSNNVNLTPQLLTPTPPIIDPDPSIDPLIDPSIKNHCQSAEQTDDELSISVQAERALSHLNLVTRSKYQPKKTSLEGINARLAEGFTLSELVLTIDYMNVKWGDDLKMSEYLRPITLFSPSKFPGYLQAAEKWHESGRPEYVNGKWLKDGKPLKGSGVDTSERDAAYRRYTSGVGEIASPSRLEIEVRKAAGKAGIRNLQASFAVQRWNSLWNEYSERLAGSGEAAA